MGRFWFGTILGLLCVLVCFVTADERPVVLSCGADGRGDTAAPVARPGKRGADGMKGDIGPPGPKGDSADVSALQKSLNNLRQRMEELQARVHSLENPIQHFQLSPREISWPLSKTYCERRNLKLCSRAQIFPRGDVPAIIGVQNGDFWVPVSDSRNEWVQVGNRPHRPGILHSSVGGLPVWGLQTGTEAFKRHVFCCI